jgi:hypothetical protein
MSQSTWPCAIAPSGVAALTPTVWAPLASLSSGCHLSLCSHPLNVSGLWDSVLCHLSTLYAHWALCDLSLNPYLTNGSSLLRGESQLSVGHLLLNMQHDWKLNFSHLQPMLSLGGRGQYQGLNSGPHAARQALYHLCHSASPFSCWVFLR